MTNETPKLGDYYMIPKTALLNIYTNRNNPEELVKIANQMYSGEIPAYSLRNKDSQILEIEIDQTNE